MADPTWEESTEYVPRWEDSQPVPAIDDDRFPGEPAGPQVSRLESLYRGAKQGATLGYSDEMYGGLAALASAIRRGGLDNLGDDYRAARDESRAEDKIARDSNTGTYEVGAIGGGLASLAAAPAAIGARLATVGGATALGAISGLGHSKSDLTNPTLENVGGAALDTGVGAGVGYVLGRAGDKISNAVSSRIAARAAARAAAQKSGQEAAEAGIQTVGELRPQFGRPDMTAQTGNATLASTMNSGSRAADADAVIAAAKSLPDAPTIPAWMLTKDRVAQDAASTALRSPSIGGRLVRNEAKPVVESMQKAATDLTGDAAAEMTPAQAGEAIRESLTNSFSRKITPARSEYEALEPILASTKLDPENHAFGIVADSLSKDSRVISNPEARQFLGQMGEEFKNLRTLADLKAFRSNLREASQKLGGTSKYVAERLQEAVTNLRDETLRTAGPTGEELLGRIRGADKGFAEAIGQASEAFGLSPTRMTPESALNDFLEALPRERLSEVLFSSKNISRLEALSKHFPDEFQQVRQAELARITRESMVRGEVDPIRLTARIAKYQPEVRALLFGEKTPMAEALQTVRSALPREVNPSGTDVRGEFRELLNPKEQLTGAALYLRSKGTPTQLVQQAASDGFSTAMAPIRQLAKPSGLAVAGTTLLNSDRVSLPSGAQKFAPILEAAKQRGDSAVKTTHYMLMQTEPEYREAMREQGEQ